MPLRATTMPLLHAFRHAALPTLDTSPPPPLFLDCVLSRLMPRHYAMFSMLLRYHTLLRQQSRCWREWHRSIRQLRYLCYQRER